MKNKVLMLNLAALLFASATFAQSVENDDMYFNASDRAKLKAQKVSEQPTYSASVKSKKSEVFEDVVYSNPTDTYTARNVNPEFAARANSQTAQADDQDYFVNNYQYKASSSLNNWNNSYNSMYNNPMYSSNYYGSSINSWNSPYYGSAYDSWGNPWCNPYYRSGWSSSFSYYMGSNWNYGWGGMGMGMGISYGYGNYGYGYPYMNSWGPSYGYGGGFYYPSTIVVVNNGSYGEAGHNIAYGKRATRGGVVSSPQEGISSRSRSTYTATPTGDKTPDGGRISSAGRGQSQADYYNRSWRNSQQSGTYPSRSSSNNSSWSNSTSGNTYNRSSSFGQSNSSFSTPSGGSSISSGGGTRTSAPASSGSGGRSRGRD